MPAGRQPKVEVDAPPELVERFLALKARKAELDAIEQRHYLQAPAEWAADKTGTFLWSKQREITAALRDHRKVAVPSCHAAGKSRTAATIAAWWIDTHPPGTAMVISTAPSYEQVHAVLWEEIRELHRKADLPGEVQRADRWLSEQGQLLGFGRRPPDHAKSAFQGHHKRYLLVIVDEAGGIPAWLWVAIDAITTGDDCKILAIGNPDDSASEFARICQDPDWHTIRISAFDTPNFTGEDVPDELHHVLVSKAWVEDKRRRWGEENPLYVAKVLGQFADAEDALIPLSWVQQAQARWNAWNDYDHDEDGRTIPGSRRPDQPGPRIVGVDVARFGEDKTCLALRKGDVVTDLRLYSKLDTVATTTLVEQELDGHPKARAIVDTVGVGGGVADLLASHGYAVDAFVASAKTAMRDSTGTVKFRNVRAAAWWNMRELLDPRNNPTVALPPDDELAAELCAPRWDTYAGAIIGVEEKDQIRRRLGRSTDRADAVIQAFWLHKTPQLDELGRATKPITGRRYRHAPDWSHLR